MNQRENFRLKDEKFNVFIPLINLLLFDKLETPDFDSENEKLSENFTKFMKTENYFNIDENDFFKTRILNFLSDLEFFKRDLIFQIILENKAYFQSVLLAYVLDNNRSINKEIIEQSQINLIKEFTNFKFEGKLVKEIYFYFVFQFEGILFYKFKNDSHVLKSEYFEIIQNICREKDFINLENF
jgi:hypothetical protein